MECAYVAFCRQSHARPTVCSTAPEQSVGVGPPRDACSSLPTTMPGPAATGKGRHRACPTKDDSRLVGTDIEESEGHVAPLHPEKPPPVVGSFPDGSCRRTSHSPRCCCCCCCCYCFDSHGLYDSKRVTNTAEHGCGLRSQTTLANRVHRC